MIFEKKALKKMLMQLNQIPFSVRFDGEEAFTVGSGSPVFSILVHKTIPKHELLTSTSIALGEAYMRRDIEVEGDLFTALTLLLAHMDQFSANQKVLHKLLLTSTKPANQKKEVCSHYDIGNDFYKLWLDDTLSYSCAYFKTPQDTLAQAQRQKIDRILRKLNLKKGMTLLDIGCGWGQLLTQAAKEYGVHCMGITLSEEQFALCSKRAQEEGLSDLLQFKLMDYRQLEHSASQFDRIVSVGMMEHVGRSNYPLFFRNISSCLKPGGVMLLHTISAMFEHPGDPWMKKYIFPGGMLPSLRELVHLSAECNFQVVDVESLRRHYVRTLLCWYDNFQKVKPQVMAQFSDEFARMWELYLCACAASFQDGVIDIHQLLLTKGTNNQLPMVRESYLV